MDSNNTTGSHSYRLSTKTDNNKNDDRTGSNNSPDDHDGSHGLLLHREQDVNGHMAQGRQDGCSRS